MPGRRRERRPGAAAVPTLALLAALVLAGCSGSGSQYVANKEDRTYFKVPSEWKLFDEDELLEADPDVTDEQRDAVLESSWRTAFDASPDPSIDHLVTTNAGFPTGLAIVRPLSPEEADSISDEAMRNRLIPLDDALDAGQAEVLLHEAVNVGNGLHGVRFRARVTADPDSEVYSRGPTFTVEQISMVDQARAKTYLLVVMCTARCFEKHGDRIAEVFDSWTVEES